MRFPVFDYLSETNFWILIFTLKCFTFPIPHFIPYYKVGNECNYFMFLHGLSVQFSNFTRVSITSKLRMSWKIDQTGRYKCRCQFSGHKFIWRIWYIDNVKIGKNTASTTSIHSFFSGLSRSNIKGPCNKIWNTGRDNHSCSKNTSIPANSP